jgi:serine phosphatase RsbU (regulator of sigma subunit)
VDDDHLGIVVADVSGKGVHAALIAAMVRSAFRTEARGEPDVRAVLTGVNEFISEDLRSDMFITCVYGILEVSTRRFSWARAGHEPIIVSHPDQETEVVSPDGFALGVVGSPDFGELLQVETLELNPGDRVLIFTDGLTEAMNTEGEEFGMERILDIMNRDNSHLNGDDAIAAPASTAVGSTPGTKSNEGQEQLRSKPSLACAPELSADEPEDLKIIERAVAAHVGSAPQSDDLTIVYLSAK